MLDALRFFCEAGRAHSVDTAFKDAQKNNNLEMSSWVFETTRKMYMEKKLQFHLYTNQTTIPFGLFVAYFAHRMSKPLCAMFYHQTGNRRWERSHPFAVQANVTSDGEGWKFEFKTRDGIDVGVFHAVEGKSRAIKEIFYLDGRYQCHIDLSKDQRLCLLVLDPRTWMSPDVKWAMMRCINKLPPPESAALLQRAPFPRPTATLWRKYLQAICEALRYGGVEKFMTEICHASPPLGRIILEELRLMHALGLHHAGDRTFVTAGRFERSPRVRAKCSQRTQLLR